MEIETHYKWCVDDKRKASHRAKQKAAQQKKCVCEQCGKEVRQIGYNAHLRAHMRKNGVQHSGSGVKLYRYCDKCDKRFTNSFALSEHISVVHEGKLLICHLCGKSFKSSKHLREHKNVEHSTDEKYQCKYCPIRKGNLCELRSHMRKHEPPKLKCKYCERMFKSRDAVTAHEREHTGERPSKCEICGNGFKDNTVLQVHLKNVHKVMKPGWKPILKRVRNKESV